MSNRSRILSDFIISSKRPRNQIAKLSGLTNTYIRNLENNEIENVPKKRIIALAVALNLDLSELETLLSTFDRSSLKTDDIPLFIDVAQSAKFSEAVMPVRDSFAYELIHLSLQCTPGHQIIVKDQPTASLMVEGHRTHQDKEILSRHPIYKDLIESIGKVRKENFFKLLKTNRVDHYICVQCLKRYIEEDMDCIERSYRFRHIVSLLEAIKTQKNLHLHLTSSCVNLLFTLKLSEKSDENGKLSYSSRAPHDINSGKRGRLFGFITENPALCMCFKEELEQISKSSINSLKDRGSQAAFLNELLRPMAAELGESFGGMAPISLATI